MSDTIDDVVLEGSRTMDDLIRTGLGRSTRAEVEAADKVEREKREQAAARQVERREIAAEILAEREAEANATSFDGGARTPTPAPVDMDQVLRERVEDRWARGAEGL